MQVTQKEPTEIKDIFDLDNADIMVIHALGAGMVAQAEKHGERVMARCGFYLGRTITDHLTLLELGSIKLTAHDMLEDLFGYELTEVNGHIIGPDERFNLVKDTIKVRAFNATPPLRKEMRAIDLITVEADFSNDSEYEFRPWQRELMEIVQRDVEIPKRMIPLVEIETPWVRQPGDER